MTDVSPQRLFNECLNQIASHFASDQTEKKIELCKELIGFLVCTPNVFDEPWTTQHSWTRPLFRGLFDIFQSKSSQDMRCTAIEMTSVLVRGFNGFKWATDSDKTSSKFVGLVSRLACLELSLLLDSSEKENNTLIGSCLAIIEHAILTLVNEDLVDNLEPKMNPDEVCTLIDTLRECVIKIMHFMIDSKDEALFTKPSIVPNLPGDFQTLQMGFIRIICLLLTEDTTIPPEIVAKLVSIFSGALVASCYGLHHIIFTGLIAYSDHEEVLEAIKVEKESFLKSIEECQECQAESSLCQSLKELMKK